MTSNGWLHGYFVPAVLLMQTIRLRKLTTTRKPSYRKDDRAMRPIYGCPKNFRQSLSTPTATFPEIFNGVLFRSILWMCVQNLKFLALTIPVIIGGIPKSLGSPWIRLRSLFSKIFNGLLFGWTLWKFWPNLKYVASPVPEIIAIGVLGWGCEPLILGRGGRRGSGMVPFERALVSSYRLSIVTFPLSLRVSVIVAFVLQHAAFSPPHLAISSLPQISPCSPMSRWMAFGSRRAKVLG